MSNVETAPTPPATVAYAPAPPRRGRGRLLLAGLALAIALVAGAGGFVLGQVTADEGPDGPVRMFHGGPGGGPGGHNDPFGQFGQPPPR